MLLIFISMCVATHISVIGMPVEVKDIEEFVRLAERASECIVKRSSDEVKLKLRAGKLFTLKTSPQDADVIIKRLRCPVTDSQKRAKRES